ncbi:MAG: tyrosine--tRNA ligase [Desulfurococcaceae archaeon]|nr:MAG: tyrosine--tRNA ligase [Desulfurococcaceae archaeon]
MGDLEKRLELAMRGAEEVVTVDELRTLIEGGGGKGYLGFEPSGLFHIGWLVWAYKFKELIEAGFKMKLLAATWHAWINDKLGGDLELIRKASKHVADVLEAIGISRSSYDLVYAEDLVSDLEYWNLIIRISKSFSLARIRRALTIMGRRAEESESDFSKLIYPVMQVADIFYMDLDLALGGIDQRKAHMLAREAAEKLRKKKIVAIHTPLLPSLLGPEKMETSLEKDELYSQIKMSKSKPEGAIFVYDKPEDIYSKIRKAYCPPREIETNPIIGIARHILLREGGTITIERKPEYGGTVELTIEELEKLYSEGKIHPLDLKNAVAKELIRILEPVRRYFENNREALETLEILRSSRITR